MCLYVYVLMCYTSVCCFLLCEFFYSHHTSIFKVNIRRKGCTFARFRYWKRYDLGCILNTIFYFILYCYLVSKSLHFITYLLEQFRTIWRKDNWRNFHDSRSSTFGNITVNREYNRKQYSVFPTNQLP